MIFKTPLSCFAIALILLGCGGSKQNDTPTSSTSNSPAISVANLPIGSANVVLGEDTPSLGQYFVGLDGTRLLIVNNNQEQATAIYKANAKGDWQRFPAAQTDTALQISQNSALKIAAIDLAQSAGRYANALGSNFAQVTFTKDGKITAQNTSGCKLNGNVGEAFAPGISKITLNAIDCSGIAGTLSGYMIEDRDYAPLKWRIIVENDKQLAEFWLAAE